MDYLRRMGRALCPSRPPADTPSMAYVDAIEELHHTIDHSIRYMNELVPPKPPQLEPVTALPDPPECPICLHLLEFDKSVITPCRHVYHDHCIRQVRITVP